MALFTPPTIELTPRASKGDPGYNLFRYFPDQVTGQTVWKDSLGVWHQTIFPYNGGAITRTFDNGVLITSTGPDEGLATAQVVFQGGHIYEIDGPMSIELLVNGFGLAGHWDDEETKWVNFAINSTPNLQYKGGDSSCAVLLADGRSLWCFADNFIGTNTNPGGLYLNALPTRNALLVRDAAGVLTQAFPEGSHPAWTNPTGGQWWWPIDIINDGVGTSGSNYVFCWEVTNGGNFGHILRNDVLQLTIFSTRAANFEVTHVNETFLIQSVYKDDAAGFHYILGLEFDQQAGGYDNYNQTTHTFSRLARCPIGSLASITTAIEYWNGTAWTSSTTTIPRLTDNHGNVIDGNADITKVGSTYILMTQPTNSATITLWKSNTITGPWHQYHVTPDEARPPFGGAKTPHPAQFVYYLPKFHEFLNPFPSTMVATYNRNIFNTPSGASGPPLTSLHVSTFTPQFIFLPPPS